MEQLRNNCPWDRKQTMESLRYLTLEETYELSQAILDNNLQEVKNELGDLLLHIVFYAKIGQEKQAFHITDVINHINKKLIDRHPHIYGNTCAPDAKTVQDNWEKIKLKQGKKGKKVLEGVPEKLPAMIKAFRMQEKAAGVGFDWDNNHQVLDKVKEELNELEQEITNKAPIEQMENEMGDILFALVNYARKLNINPENALEKTNKKFIRRFEKLEEMAQKEGNDIKNMTLKEMDQYWEKTKKEEKNNSY